MNQNNLQALARDMRADERYPYLDTVLIGPNAGAMPGWFNTFQELAEVTELNFFNMRNEALVGAMYCNQDNEGDLDVGYKIKSIGIELIMPPIGGRELDTEQPGRSKCLPFPYSVFAEIMNHCSFRFYIGQDEVVNGPVNIFPAGYGSFGGASTNADVEEYGSNTTNGMFTNGWPDMKNRWTFAKAKEIPRNRNIKGIIELPEIWRKNLKNMVGPDHLLLESGNGSSGNSWVPARCGWRVTLNGTRIVQLRNAATYY